MKSWIIAHRLYLAWVISLVSFFASLYYGEILQMEPCRFCWYQRIAMFPLVLFLGIAWYKEDKALALYSMPLVFLGGAFSLYQSFAQIFPEMMAAGLCGEGGHCTEAGMTPYLSFLAFLSIGLLTKK